MSAIIIDSTVQVRGGHLTPWAAPARQVAPDRAPVTFDQVLWANGRVQWAGRPGSDDAPQDAETELDDLLHRFQSQQGRVRDHYFGRRGETGVALTEGRVDHSAKWKPWLRRRTGGPRLHIAVDPAITGDAVALVSRCERLRVKTELLLRGDERDRLMLVLYDRVAQLLRLNRRCRRRLARALCP